MTQPCHADLMHSFRTDEIQSGIHKRLETMQNHQRIRSCLTVQEQPHQNNTIHPSRTIVQRKNDPIIKETIFLEGPIVQLNDCIHQKLNRTLPTDP